LGVASWPYLSGTSDTNEETQPITPFVRSIDAFNPSDKAIRVVASGGITTALVLPGSGNLMGGEAYAFKLRPMDTSSNDDMLVQSGIDPTAERKWRYMKMACGENPKVYTS
jgi:imidazolonepropionase-like amidohydrolase